MTNCSEISSACLLDAVRDAMAGGDTSPEALAEGIRARLGVADEGGASSIARAFAEGVAEFASYAASAIVSGSTAVDFEVEAVLVARRAVRPMLQAKLQAHVDVLLPSSVIDGRVRELRDADHDRGGRVPDA